MDKRIILKVLAVALMGIYFAWLARWQIVPFSVGAGSGGSHDATGDTEVVAGVYRLDRWTGTVTYYRNGFDGQILGSPK